MSAPVKNNSPMMPYIPPLQCVDPSSPLCARVPIPKKEERSNPKPLKRVEGFILEKDESGNVQSVTTSATSARVARSFSQENRVHWESVNEVQENRKNESQAASAPEKKDE
jgi:hypothetical protein